MIEPGIPQSALYSAIAALCGAIIYMARLWVKHHEEAATNWRTERAALMETNRALAKELSEALDRNTRTTAHLVTSMFFIPRELKRDAMETVREIDDARAREASR